MSCEYPPQAKQLRKSPTPEESEHTSPVSRQDTAVREFKEAVTNLIRSTAPPAYLLPKPPGCSVGQSFSIEDMGLLHHYTAYTSLTFADLPEIIEIYRVTAPQLAFSDPDLLSSLLAISALHRAHVDPDPERQQEYFRRATKHQSRSIHVLQNRIANITQENCVGLYLSACILSIYTLAEKSWLWRCSRDAASLDDVVRCLRLFRGVPSILRHENHAVFGWIMDGPLKPIGDGFLYKPTGRFTTEQESYFAVLREFLVEDRDAGEEERGVYLEALRVLREYAEPLLDGRVQRQIETVGLTLAWPSIVSEQYLKYLGEPRRGAILLLAQYAALFARLGHFWWAKAWGKTVLAVSVELLPEVWKWAIRSFCRENEVTFSSA
ncbi:hypothetical protein DIS24_g11626 [Lasiodiplodia hormozganensis]|uniref:Sterol uptake control protein 2 n=1 Tax=Lasiodiplodia hormozganensis TaxID=869390 RepID=A0AA39WNJ7_9PEZI|nr:hypothetical protein DIS24_g11626 [Lasiodiplodia hormozganensis]